MTVGLVEAVVTKSDEQRPANASTQQSMQLSTRDFLGRVLRAGARGYIMKEAGGEKLLAAMRRVLAGEVYLSPEMSARILENVAARRPRGSSSPIEKLTDREFEIFQMIGRGQSTRDIAAELHLSSKTVDVHRSHLKEKLGLRDSTSLIRHAVRWVETQGEA